MKFLVDEMPYYRSDCPFYEEWTNRCKCACDYDRECEYFKNDRNPEYCDWLKEINDG